ncbi:C2H2-type zinc finger-containing protein [Tieghemostelium lacteum]|uniref:C2H2-type zinc finger-containing protein n=1 Tax=Tieghemostelium lacteum TaxID=361077 RepID=A0A151Z541_TIELA|nr:C2H2-type zinc finger-containing protein [Tieghemostelium lacteum]|eukprot:KYQ89080.1 C2H2-type zinc finger-containing protein [Tieghemostelium lacteum]
MSSTLLERTRNLHENIERYELLIENEMNIPPPNFKETILQNHRVNHYLESSIDCAKELQKIYNDDDESRKNELESMSGKDIFGSFYGKLKEIKEYHRKYPDLKDQRNNSSLYFNATVPFLGNEHFGKYLDLNEIYDVYLNLPFLQNRIDYTSYLSKFYEFQYANIVRMKYPVYREYLEKLYQYLISFLERTQPLFDLNQNLERYEKEFNEKWDKHEYDPKMEAEGDRKDDDEDGGDTSSPLYCKACRKMFSSESVFKGHLGGKKHKLNQTKMTSDRDSHSYLNLKQRKPTTFLEFKISKLGELLSDQTHATKEMVLRKQSRSATEINVEEEPVEDEEINIDDMDTVDEPTKLKIANYPVDFSGKPIPYWVYKLNELGVEYKCEICGNQSYWGRKTYEKHFQESRHSYGMSCIGVPNTIHFHEITKIKDALELWAKIKKQNNEKTFKSDRDEEYEDENGEVMSKIAYEMLVKQGIIRKRKNM